MGEFCKEFHVYLIVQWKGIVFNSKILLSEDYSSMFSFHPRTPIFCCHFATPKIIEKQILSGVKCPFPKISREKDILISYIKSWVHEFHIQLLPAIKLPCLYASNLFLQKETFPLIVNSSAIFMKTLSYCGTCWGVIKPCVFRTPCKKYYYSIKVISNIL